MIWKSKQSNLFLASVVTITMLAWWSQAEALRSPGWHNYSNITTLLLQDTIKQDTGYIPSRRPTFTPSDRRGNPFSSQQFSSPLLLGQPSNIKLNVEYDDSLQLYNINETIGDSIQYRTPSSMTLKQFSELQQRQAIRDYWRTKSGGLDGEDLTSSRRLVPKIYISPVFDRIFGGNFVDIQPNGNISLKFGARFNRNQNPTIPLRQQRTGDFEFDQNISLNLVGKVGEKLAINFNWDNNANFDFENNMKLDYTGYEEEIIRKVEAGNVSLPLNNSLITGAQNLFGVKTQLQFGRLGVTAIASNVRGRNDEVIIQNGAQNQPFEIRIDEYDKDRHYFLSHFFRDRYDRSLANLPLVNSGIVIRRLELYVTNNNRSTENLRNMVAYMDLGEPDPFRNQFERVTTAPASNAVNTLYSVVANNRNNGQIDEFLRGQGLQKGVDFEHVRARRLDPREYKFNPQLGYISLNTALLPDQVLGVAFEYTYNGKTYKVGELMEDYQNLQDQDVIHMKLLKATNPSLEYPTWDLMMKNVYSLDATQVNRENFQLRIVYKDDQSGVDISALTDQSPIQGVPLVEVFNLDNVNTNNDKPNDGNFDFLPGITIDPETGRIYFPEVEPFGDYLRDKLQGDPELSEKYVFEELYNQTQTDAQQNNSKAKFFLTGRLQATSADEITLPGFRIAEGSVVVYSGGTRLTEGTDYQVFYDLGRIKILNPSYISSASDLRVTYEKAELLNIQPRALLGARFDYQLTDDINLGGTVLHLSEQPYINRVSIGDEPSNNTIYGVDINLQKESRFLTKMTDALPLLQTKAPSSITFSGEFAQLVPAATKSPANEDGTSYIDDFEGSETPYSLGGFSNNGWRLASTPAPLVPGEGLAYSYNRAKLAWYTIDQIFYRDADGLKPDNITDEELKNHYVRGVFRTEVFPNRDPEVSNSYEYTFDLAYYPRERGQYNYNPSLTSQGLLSGDPRDNWGGISREITFDTDFDNANIEYIEFWLMDPFITGKYGRKDAQGNPIANNTGGELVLNLGSISEDILRDNQYAFENGLPTTANSLQNVTETIWGRMTTQQFLTDAFTGIPGGRQFQDIGLDGLNDAAEADFFRSSFLNQIPGTPPQIVVDDPSADNFLHHLDPIYDQQNAGVLARYKNYNGMDGNSPENSQFANYAFPDKEDLNRDNVISDVEQYYEYKINLQPDQLNVGQNYIVDQVTNTDSRTGDEVSWYQFRIPVRRPTGNVGNISGFKSIRFMRMYMTEFQDPVVLRMVQFQFVANQWRAFQQPITEGRPCLTCTDDARSFTISTVNIEENGEASAGIIPYRVPPGIERLRDYASTNNRRQNEQSLQLCVEDLKDSFSKAVYKNVSIDMLIYKRLKMYIHAQTQDPNTQTGDVQAFVRLGTDFTQNYYEYVVPLTITPQGSSTTNEIWPQENMVDISLEELVNAKVARNRIAGYNKTIPYEVQLGNGKIIRIVGNPDFSEVQGVMIGMRNPSQAGSDARPHSLCMWVDELRVTDFKNSSGWAANARVNTKLADFANLTATGAYTTVGFGGLQQKIAQRARENTALFDVSANIVADKFLPEKSGVKIPLSVQYGTLNSEPQFDPLDKDVPLEQSLSRFDSKEARDEYRKEVTTRETRKSFSLLNVRKERTDPNDKIRPYDIENISLSYAYAERLFTDIETDRDFTKTYTGGIAYTYNNTTAKNYAPFEKSQALKSPYLRLIKDFNFTPLPSSFAFRADLDRRYNETFLQRRDPVTGLTTTRGIEPTFQKYFYFNRIYDMKWDITKSLSLDYTATNRAVVDEPDDRINNEIDSLQYKNDIIWENLSRGGRTTNFNQTIAANYKLPLDKFPLVDWIGAETRYATTYIWTAGSTALNNDADFRLGNTAENNKEFTVNGRLDLVKLYNKVKFLKSANTPAAPVPVRAANDTTAKAAPNNKVVNSIARFLMMARSVNFTYLQNKGTMLPGYLPSTRFLGFEEGFDAPGLPFILGKQYDLDQLYNRAASNGWYTDSSQYLNTPLSAIVTESFTARANLEPFKAFNIQVDVTRNMSEINEVFYRKEFDDFGNISDEAQRQNPITTGAFSTSFMALGTIFESGEAGVSEAFENYIRYRYAIQDKLAAANPAAGTEGYTLNSQDVLMNAFLFAYQGRNVDGYKAESKSPFSRLPIPNWRVDYNGLSNLPFFQQWFSQVNLTHAYSSTYNITNFTTSLAYETEPNGFPTQVNEFGQIVPYYIVSQLTVAERLAPLLGVNFRTKTNLTGRLEYKVERNLSLNLTNAQITETNVKDYVIGLGYATTNFRIPIRIGGQRKVLENELNMRLDFSVRDNQTVQRAIARDDQGVESSQNQITNGTRQLQLRPTIDYLISERVNIQFYVLRTVSDPKISTSFRNSVTEGGIQLRVSLQ
ncbi:cell surface protein SprA [Pontibacter populi]|uniref:Cell surface protein SprA n=1 Tax=Pontibacter populi TaxID=890055 RepID=A0ABV1RWU1_9BACT